MRTLIIAAALAALAVPAYAQQSTAPQANTASGAPSTPQFVDQVAVTNLYEIQAGQLAEQKSQNAQVQNYAKMIVQDHQKSQSELKTAASGVKGVQIPTQLDQAHQQKIDQLKSASGNQFLQDFKTQQVQGHQQGIQLGQKYAQSGDNSQLKQFAQGMLPTLQKHLQEAQQLPTASNAPTVGSGAGTQK